MDHRRENDTLQLQLWDPRTKAYVVAQSETITAPGWRRVDPAKNRPLTVPPLRRTALKGSGRSISDVQRDYLAWAEAKGLKSIHGYGMEPNFIEDKTYYGNRRDRAAPIPGPIYTGRIDYISQKDQFAVIETSDDTAWLEDAS